MSLLLALTGNVYGIQCDAGAYSLVGNSAELSISVNQPSYSNEVALKHWYVKSKDRIRVFASAADADAFIHAERVAEEAIAKANKTSRRARKRLRERIYQVEGVQPIESVQVDYLASLLARFNMPVALPELITQQDLQQIMQMRAMALELQDEEDVELLLLGV